MLQHDTVRLESARRTYNYFNSNLHFPHVLSRLWTDECLGCSWEFPHSCFKLLQWTTRMLLASQAVFCMVNISVQVMYLILLDVSVFLESSLSVFYLFLYAKKMSCVSHLFDTCIGTFRSVSIFRELSSQYFICLYAKKINCVSHVSLICTMFLFFFKNMTINLLFQISPNLWLECYTLCIVLYYTTAEQYAPPHILPYFVRWPVWLCRWTTPLLKQTLNFKVDLIGSKRTTGPSLALGVFTAILPPLDGHNLSADMWKDIVVLPT